jgi:hypothetical protein
MSLGVAIKGAEGIVLAADSRVTLQATLPGEKTRFPIFYDNATKLLSFEKQPFIGTVTYGLAVIGTRTAHSLLPEFEVSLTDTRLSVMDFASKLSDFFLEQWKEKKLPADFEPQMTFVVAGFGKDQAYGEVYVVDIPKRPKPSLRTGVDGFGMTWGGQLDIVSRIVHGFDPALPVLLAKQAGVTEDVAASWLEKIGTGLQLRVPYEFLPLQDCINLATAMVRTTMVFQDSAVRVRGVGGPIDLAVITRTEGLRFIQRKTLQGEVGYALQGGGRDERATDCHDQRAAAPKRKARRPAPTRG